MSQAQWMLIAIASLILLIELASLGKLVLSPQVSALWQQVFSAPTPNTPSSGGGSGGGSIAIGT